MLNSHIALIWELSMAYAPVIQEDKPCSTPISAQYICKNTKNIQKSDFMDGFCLQGELDLTLFYKIAGNFDNQKSLMTENDRDLNDRTLLGD